MKRPAFLAVVVLVIAAIALPITIAASATSVNVTGKEYKFTLSHEERAPRRRHVQVQERRQADARLQDRRQEDQAHPQGQVGSAASS